MSPGLSTLRKQAAKLAGCETWPVIGAHASANASESGLATVIIARRRPDGGLAVGQYLVDLGCLGVKNADCHPRTTHQAYVGLLERLSMNTALAPVSPSYAARVVTAGRRYAASLGFEPHPDFRLAGLLLRGIDAGASPEPVTCGRHGKPFFIAGPRDDAHAILATLDATVGPGGYDYVLPL